MSARYLFGPLIVVIILSSPAMAQHSGGTQSSSPYMDVMSKMHQSMPKDATGNTDVDFARMMIPHHQGAVDAAKIQLQSGKDPMLRKMAEKMVKDQEKEIADLKKWLEKQGKK